MQWRGGAGKIGLACLSGAYFWGSNLAEERTYLEDAW